MSLFKSTKKKGFFSKFKKMVKKIAVVLLIAAAVYFGGAYLMSMGAGHAQAASVAGSFTKSAGVWKSFLSGITNGTASSSAVAYAEASYKAMQTGATVAESALAGTVASQGVGQSLQVSDAINNGVAAVNDKRQLDATSPDTSVLEKVNQIVDQRSVIESTAEVDPNTTTDLTTGQIVDRGSDINAASIDAAVNREVASTEGSGANVKGEIETVAGDVKESTVDPATVDKPEVKTSAVDDLTQRINTMDDRLILQEKNRHKEVMAANDRAHKMNKIGMLMKGGGLLLNTIGKMQEAATEEEELARKREWKPTGREVNVWDTSKLKYAPGTWDTEEVA